MSWTKSALATSALAALLALAGCDAARPVSGAETTAGATSCTPCHGDPTRTDADPLVKAAPPASVRGNDGGAHLSHLRGGAFRGPIACGECHAVPTDPRHSDGTVAVTFPGGAAGPSARWDEQQGTCSGVACHGGALSGGTGTTPGWYSSASLDCTGCHGFPPANHAASSTSCTTCHPGTVGPNGGILVANGMHVNGRVDVNVAHPDGWANPASHGSAAKRDLASCRGCHGNDYAGGTTGVSCNACHGGTAWQTDCTFCHGDPSRGSNPAAPPRGTQGETETSARAVGAHQRHLSGGAIGPAVACTECHAIPSSLAHVDGTAAVAFGPAARRDLAQPAWNGSTCASTYCHGATLGAGGTKNAPAWTGGSAEAACGTCHGTPPPAPHTTSSSCGACHTGYTITTVNPTLHLDGTVEASSGHPANWSDPTQHGYAVNRGGLATCKTCHGTDLTGGTAGISCNSCHGGTAWQTNCTFCHGDRASGRASPPLDTQGGTATTNVSVGAHASHVGTTLTTPLACTECHANRAGSNVITDAAHVDGNGVAEVVLGARATNGGAPAQYARTSATAATCASTYCHGRFTGGANGGAGVTMSWTSSTQATCTSCHGAPPPAPHTASTDCASCHTGYTATSVNPATHINGTVEASGGHPAGWANKDQHGYTVNRSGLASCKGCHGTSLDGVGGTGPSCASCHEPAGITSWQSNCTFCHGNRATGRASPPVDTQGGSATTNVSVGVHASHVGTTLAAPLACTECHANRAGSNVITDAAHVDGDGVAEVVLGTLARTGGAAATYTRTSATAATCASTYCHGRFTGGASGGAGANMSWTSTTQVTCTSCHGAPPSTGQHGRHSGRSCGDCHPGYTTTAVNAATHVNGSKQIGNRITSLVNRTCTNSCHGNETW